MILKDSGFLNHKDLFKEEFKELQKYCYKDESKDAFIIKDEFKGKILNTCFEEQWNGNHLKCPECGHTPHLSSCTRAKICEECKG